MTAGNLPNCDPGIIITDTIRHAAKKRKRPNMTIPEGFGTLAGIGFNKEHIRVRQTHGETMSFLQRAGNIGKGLKVIHLSLARRMIQRHKHFLVGPLEIQYQLLDNRVAAVKTPLGFKPLENPLGGMTLLAGLGLIGLQNALNPVYMSIQFAAVRLGATVSWWLTVS